MQKKTPDKGFLSTERPIPSCTHSLIPPGLLRVPPAGSCHSNLGSGMCPVPIPGWAVELGDRAFHWCCTPGNGFGAAAVPQQKSPKSPHSLGESSQRPEMAQPQRSWSKGFPWESCCCLCLSEPGMGTVRQGRKGLGCLGGRRCSLFHRVRAHSMKRHQARQPRDH